MPAKASRTAAAGASPLINAKPRLHGRFKYFTCEPRLSHAAERLQQLQPAGLVLEDLAARNPVTFERNFAMAPKMWEVDPETRSKLQEISRSNENSKCVDCGAPSPQWVCRRSRQIFRSLDADLRQQASPKFGIFFCLACSGIHRSLGVHISFVRSVTMDAFKTAEVKRMEYGGNQPWKDFFNNHKSNKLISRDFEACTISERYDSEAGEEWKDRLTSKVEGTEYVPGTSRKVQAPAVTGITPAASGRSTPVSNIRSAPQQTGSPSQKTRNEAYFASKGEENASRPDNIAPSQGGKYGGFGSSPMPSSGSSTNSIPTGDDFQRDPVAALTKGFGWLSSAVSKQAVNMNKTYIQPGVKSIAEGDFAAQARATAMTAGTYVQQGAKGVGDQFNRFVDPDAQPAMSGQRQRAQPEKKDFWDTFGQDPNGPPKERRDFWDDFAAAGEVASQSKTSKPTSIGTSAMKTNSSSGSAMKKDEGDGWSDW